MKKLLIPILAVALFSCGKGEKPDSIHSIDSRIILSGNPVATPLSEIAEKITLIPLETRDDALIGMYPQVRIVDSLMVVFSHETGLFVFDSRTGRFKYKIPGFRDRGPLGYSGSSVPLLSDDRGRIILQKWDRLGVWDYTTGRMLDHTIPVHPYTYSPLFFLNDSLLLGNRMNIDPGATSTLDVISLNDGSVVREYGFMEKTDMNPNVTSMLRVGMSEYADYINYTHFVHDYIYGIDKKTLALEPRFALDLGSLLKSNEIPPTGGGVPEEFIAVSSMSESDRYLFVEFAQFTQDNRSHFVCYDKMTGQTVYLDKVPYEMSQRDRLPGFVDDIGSLPFRFFPFHITPDGRAYSVAQAIDLIAELGPERSAEWRISEEDNPVLVVVDLKK